MPMIDCPECCGRTWLSFHSGTFPCPVCAGTGRVPDDFFPEDSEELPMLTCPDCDGDTFLEVDGVAIACVKCSGTGRVPDSSELRDPDEEPEQLTSPDTREE